MTMWLFLSKYNIFKKHKSLKNSLFILLCSLLTASPAFATNSTGNLSGTVLDQYKKAAEGLTVRLSGLQTAYVTDDNGKFNATNIKEGLYTVSVTGLGYKSAEQKVRINAGKTTSITITIESLSTQLQDVTVIGKNETQQVREQAIRAVVVDTRAVADQPATLAELMNRAPGIRIRQNGGLGNAVDVSVNGFQGNSVQYFRDGIPLEYLGGGYGINNVPLNLLQRTEIYKGVIPVSLGGDALGGAVNLVTPNHFDSQLSASYEVGSFNTHIANISLYHTNKKNQHFFGVDAFYNYSDNNYKADVEVVNENANLEPARVKLFHNGYKHYFTEVYAGFKNKPWTDELRFSVALYDLQRESQHPTLMTNPYGAVKLQNSGFVPSIRYKKALWDDKLSIDQFLTYSTTNRNRTDTIRGSFDWFGNFTPREQGIGESPRASLSDIDFSNAISRTLLAFRINENHSLEANIVLNYNRRIGSDPYGFRFNGTDIDVLSKEAIYQKTIAGLGWESKWLDGRLTNQLSAKFFSFSTKGINAFMANDTDLNNYTTSKNTNWGIAEAVKYQINDNSFVRASAELTNRLPRQEELFGDNDTRAPNFNLEPERSFNVNVGYRYEKNKYAVEVGAFYRKTKGMILLVPVQPPFSQYTNLDSVRGVGVDIDVAYKLNKNLDLTANATLQDNRMVDIGSELHKWQEGTRLRNTPYFFSNLGLTGNYQHVFQKKDALKPYIYYNFIREFYLNAIPKDKEPQGFLGLWGKVGVPVTNVVPNQSLLSAGFNYVLPSNNIIIGAEVKNLLDAKLYDYYKIQRPGRSVHFKINYYIKSIKK